MDPVTLTKGDAVRVAYNPTTLVRLQYDGWRPAGDETPVDVVEHVDSPPPPHEDGEGHPLYG